MKTKDESMAIFHWHHIIPRHMGGNDSSENLIRLSIEEHAMAHLNLYEEYGKKEDLWAYQLLSKQVGYDEVYKELLTKNAYDSIEKQKTRGTGLFCSRVQSKKAINVNSIKVSCLGCKKVTSYPVFHRHHMKKCFSDNICNVY